MGQSDIVPTCDLCACLKCCYISFFFVSDRILMTPACRDMCSQMISLSVLNKPLPNPTHWRPTSRWINIFAVVCAFQVCIRASVGSHIACAAPRMTRTTRSDAVQCGKRDWGSSRDRFRTDNHARIVANRTDRDVTPDVNHQSQNKTKQNKTTHRTGSIA